MSNRRIDSQNPLVGNVFEDVVNEAARRVRQGAAADAQRGQLSPYALAAISLGTAVAAPFVASGIKGLYNRVFPKNSTSKEMQQARKAGKKAIRDLAGLPGADKDYLTKKAKAETSSQGTYTQVNQNSSSQFTTVSPSEVDMKNDVYRNTPRGGFNKGIIIM